MDKLARPWLWPRLLLMGLVQAYRWLLKPWLGNACRFEPTCSAYALLALQRHGALRGSALAGWRLARCHPWCEGGFDPVPERPDNPAAGLFTRLGGPQHPASRSPRPSSGDLP
jgi:putative membrane protein insertion efficiency factor